MIERIDINPLLKRVEKPGRYIGNEVNSVTKDPDLMDCNFCFAFPDKYEIGMSYLGLQILYNIINQEKNIYCERTFAPDIDMENEMRKNNIPLFTLESKIPVRKCDFFGFTLQYEMSFTNILNMIDLAGLNVLKEKRTEDDPIIICGGPCSYNPEPLTDFIDIFLIGDGEELLPKVLNKYIELKKKGLKKSEIIENLAVLDSVYVPSLYKVEYNEDNTINKLCKLKDNIQLPIKRAIIPSVEDAIFPTKPIIPMVEAVHDRAVVETFRGCTRGCRFCQAGMIYRPVRERSKETILKLIEEQIKNTGHDELSLLSLSTSDYSDFENMIYDVIDYTKKKNVSVSLPSLRIDKFAFEVLNRIQEYKKSGLTYAVEAGTQRLRDVINKGVTEDDVIKSIREALILGWNHVKLYFMIGLPTETYSDLDGIIDLAKKIKELSYEINGKKGGRFNLTISVSNFVPKADTPFQWVAQDSEEELHNKHNYLFERLKPIKGVTFNYHDNITSSLEAVIARGDRRVGKLIYEAYKLGCKFDGWTEHFDPKKWEEAFKNSGIDKSFYSERVRDINEILPWDIIDCAVSKEYFKNEFNRAMNNEITPDCRYGCNNCGINERTNCPLGGIYG